MPEPERERAGPRKAARKPTRRLAPRPAVDVADPRFRAFTVTCDVKDRRARRCFLADGATRTEFFAVPHERLSVKGVRAEVGSEVAKVEVTDALKAAGVKDMFVCAHPEKSGQPQNLIAMTFLSVLDERALRASPFSGPAVLRK